MDPVSLEAEKAFVRARGFAGRFDAAFVLGTGLGPLVDEVEGAQTLAYAEIPHFPQSGVSGHAARLVAGTLEGRRVLLFQGRAHYYETGDAGAMRVPVGLVTGARDPGASSSPTRPAPCARRSGPAASWRSSDHLNLSGANPLLRDHSEAPLRLADRRLRPGLAGDPAGRCRGKEPGSSFRRASMRGFPGRVSRRRPRSAWCRSSAATSSACRRCRR